MTENHFLTKLRDLPLPSPSPELTASVRVRAHAELRARSQLLDQHRPLRQMVFARSLAAAMAVTLGLAHVAWTVSFLGWLHAVK